MQFPISQEQPQGQPQDFPQAQSQSEQSYQPSQEEIIKGHQQIDAVMDGLIKLLSIPKGELNKKDVFDETSIMIAHGAFPTPESKQQLIGELANLPDNEDGIRKTLGQHLLQLSVFRDHYKNAFGEHQSPTEEMNGGI